MANLHQPMISEIAGPHFFVAVIVGRILGIDHDVAIVIGRARIIAPNVGFRDLVIGIFAAGRQLRFVTKNFSDGKNPGGSAAVSFLFVQSLLILPGDSAAPRESTFAKQHRHRRRNGAPIAASGTFEALHLPAH